MNINGICSPTGLLKVSGVPPPPSKEGSLVSVEDRITGVVRFADYLFYVSCGARGHPKIVSLGIVSVYCASEGFRILADWNLGNWASA